MDAVARRRGGDGRADAVAQRAVADDDEVDVGRHERVRGDGVERPLLVGEAPGEQHARVRHVGRRVGVRPGEQAGVEARRHHVDAGGVDAVLDGGAGGGLGEDEHGVGPAHDAALERRAEHGERAAAAGLDRARQAAVQGDDERHPRPPGDGLGQRQDGEVLALVGVHEAQVRDEGPAQADQLAHGVRRPQLAQRAQRRPGAHDRRRPPEPGARARGAEPRRQHVLPDAEPVEAAGELGGVVLHPADRVVRRGVGAGERLGRRLEDRAQAQHGAADGGAGRR